MTNLDLLIFIYLFIVRIFFKKKKKIGVVSWHLSMYEQLNIHHKIILWAALDRVKQNVMIALISLE